MWARPTIENGSSFLPTPKASDYHDDNSPSEHARKDPRLAAVSYYFPTPAAADGNGGGRFNTPGRQKTLPGTARELITLPTPGASDSTGSGVDPDGRRAAGRHVQIIDAVKDVDFGKYQPAVDRWADTIGVPAPAPTTPNKNGNPALSLAFDEWLMGVPGRITSVPGLARKHVLKICGNGVVPQQAEAAYDHLLEGIEL